MTTRGPHFWRTARCSTSGVAVWLAHRISWLKSSILGLLKVLMNVVGSLMAGISTEKVSQICLSPAMNQNIYLLKSNQYNVRRYTIAFALFIDLLVRQITKGIPILRLFEAEGTMREQRFGTLVIATAG